MRWGLIGLCVLLGLFGLTLGGGALWLRGSLPTLSGELRVAGLGAPAEILRDADGMVTLRAQSEADAAFALGFAHAQDRLWQMDFIRRAAAGRIAEVAGARALPQDRFMRTLGLYRVAEANLSKLPPDTLALLEAYAAGVNAFLAARTGPLPPAFQLLRYEPEPWRPADRLAWGRLMALQLSGNWRDEILRARLARRLTPEQIALLWPSYPEDAPTTLAALAAATEALPLERFADLLPWDLAPKDASNAWVLSGARTETGAPILANDPHLGLSAPGFWYLARIETPERTRSGATAPSLPLVVLGQNGHVAWGLTTTHGDTQDLFIERVLEDDPTRYETPEGPRPFEVREEVIQVRGQDPETWRVRTTRHGPVISDAIAERLEEIQEHGTVLALAWPALRHDDRTAVAIHAMNRARSVAEVRAALKDFHSPLQNVVFADRDGRIGFATAGRVPLRKSGDGRQPAPGWSGAADWLGEVPFEALPFAADPKSGRFVNANNRVVSGGYRYLLAADWPGPYRAQRIEDLLNGEAAAPGTLEGAVAMQLDVTSLAARALLPLLLASEPASERAQAAHAILDNWDGRMTRAQAAPLIFAAWTAALTRALLADELGPAFDAFRTPKAGILTRILTEAGDWCDDVGTEAREDCLAQLSAALEDALDALEERYGGSLADLRWGEAHRAPFAHPVLSYVPLFDALFGFGLETPGGNATVNRGGFRPGAPGSSPAAAFAHRHGAGYRAVYDLADPDNSRFMIATGQSGNPFSPWYGNMAERWRDGHDLKLVGHAKVAQERLRLTPR